jgi:hypothetical protein
MVGATAAPAASSGSERPAIKPVVPAGGGVPLSRLTGRGALVVMTAVFGLGLAAQRLAGSFLLAGLAYLLGCAAAARYTRRADLVTVAVTPPLVFFCLLLLGTAVSATGNTLLSVAGGSALSLARTAPWLFAGTAVSLIIGWFRGLPGCLARLRSDLRASGAPESQPSAAATAGAGAPQRPPG